MNQTLLPHEEINRVRDALARPGPSILWVSGPRGVGKTTLIHHAVGDDPAAVVYCALSLPDRDHRELLARRLTGWAGGEAVLPTDADWPALLGAVADEVDGTRRRLVLVLDDAPRLVESRSRLPSLLAQAWARTIRARGLPVHLILAGRAPHLESALGGSTSELGELRTLDVRVEPLDFRHVAELVRGYAPADRLKAWTVFGGLPLRLRHLDPSLTLATNVQRAVLDPEAPLLLEGIRTLEEDLSSVARYAGVLGALAGGAREWGRIVEETSGVDTGGQMAPYLARLEELGWVRSERSLDAGPRSRRRRYHITDPFLSFWYRLVLPWVSDIEMRRSARVWSTSVRPGLDALAALLFPAVCREYLRRYADERLPAVAREVGGLWGRDHDVDVAGTLWTGPVVYGSTHWQDAPVGEEADDALSREIGHTRYGFGREARLRLLFASGAFDPGLTRRAARDPLLHLVRLDDLVGT